MFEQTFKNIDDILHKDAGCGSELDYVEQTSWILFLKYLDDLEKDRATAAELTGKTYTPIIDKEYRWNTWAMPLRQAQGTVCQVKIGRYCKNAPFTAKRKNHWRISLAL